MNSNYSKIISWSISTLKQKQDLLRMILTKDMNDYTKKQLKFYNASIGSHIRHSCDHYDKILTLYDTRVIQYDKRLRNTTIEYDINYAINRCNDLIQTLRSTDTSKSPHPNHPVIIEFQCNNNTSSNSDDNMVQLGSDVMRELAFVTHHAVHHISTIKLMMEDMNYNFQKDSVYGLANSTISSNSKVDNK